MRRKGRLISLREERGITTVVVAISLIGLFSAIVLSLDFGSAWANRRAIVTATDASALHQAQVAALTGSLCPSYMDYLTRNVSASDLRTPACSGHPDPNYPGTGYILVEARKLANAPFGGLFGIGETQPYSLSAVEYGFTNPTGLRPMAFCLDNPHVLQWVWYQNWLNAQPSDPDPVDPNFGQLDETTYNDLKGNLDAGRPPVKGVDYAIGGNGSTGSVLYVPPPGTTGSEPRIDYPQGDSSSGSGGVSYDGFGVVHRMFFTKDTVYESGNCGSSTGNWGWIALNDGTPSTDNQNEWILNGYDGTMSAGDCNNDGTPDTCTGDTGSSGGAGQQELQKLVDSEAQFYIPIFTNVSGGTGSNAEFEIWGFLPLILRGFKVTGAEKDRYFDFEFKDQISSGPCCNKTGGLNVPKGVRICEVDHDGAMTDDIIRARCGQGTTSP